MQVLPASGSGGLSIPYGAAHTPDSDDEPEPEAAQSSLTFEPSSPDPVAWGLPDDIDLTSDEPAPSFDPYAPAVAVAAYAPPLPPPQPQQPQPQPQPQLSQPPPHHQPHHQPPPPQFADPMAQRHSAGRFGAFDDETSSPFGVRAAEEGRGLHGGEHQTTSSLPPSTGLLRGFGTPDDAGSPRDDDAYEDDRSMTGSDGLLAAVRAPAPEGGAVHVATAQAMSAQRAALTYLILWRNPALSGLVFALFNVFFLLLVYGGFTVLGLLANTVLVSIFVHVLYRLASLAYTRFTNKRLDAYAAIKQHVGQSGALDFDFASVEETMAELSSGPIRLDFLTPLAGALEGALSLCLCEVKDAILLKSFAKCVKVTACAWFVAFFCASFDAATVMHALTVGLFTLPKVWSMRSSAVDDVVRSATVRVHALWITFHENVLSKLPSASVLKDM